METLKVIEGNFEYELRSNTASPKEIVDFYEVNNISFNYYTLIDFANKIVNLAERIEMWWNGQLIGLCACYMNDKKTKISYVTHIAISKTLRRRGIGKFLITAVEEKAKNKGFNEMRLEVNRDNNAAYNFYVSNDYSPIESRESKILMKKILK